MTLLAEERARPATPRPRLSGRADLMTCATAAWLIAGLFLDGWAHSTQKPESFFSPWHGVFYSGFLAAAVWHWWIMCRTYATGRRGRSAVPTGYGLGLAGLAVFAFGGTFDLAWHELFGIEVDIEALLSPSHLLLFAGALLLVTSPFRAAWSDTEGSRAPTFGALLPAVLSLTLTSALIAFMFMYLSPFTHAPASVLPYRYIAQLTDRDAARFLTELVAKDGIASVLLSTVVFMGPALLLVRRWRPPRGSLTVLFGTVGLLLSALESFFLGWTTVAALVAGMFGDVLVARLLRSPRRRGAYLAFAAAVPAVLWLTYFAVIQFRFGVGWPVELWAGVSALSAFAGAGLAVLSLPTPPEGPTPSPGGGPTMAG